MRTRSQFFRVQVKSALAIFLLFGVVTAPVQAAITTNGIAIDSLGQYNGESATDPMPSYTKAAANDAPNRFGFNGVYGGAIDQTNRRFFQADQQNNRVLAFDLNPDGTFVDHVPDAVLGQPNFVSNTAALGQAGLTNPVGLAFDAARGYLFVSQGVGANRVTVFDVNSIVNGENAINVLGQGDFTTGIAATTQAGMNDTYALAFDPGTNYLYVNQISGNRVTVYDTTTIVDGENAIHVIGQVDFTASVAATTQDGLNNPRGVALDTVNDRLFIANYGAHRVTVYDISAITDGENAVNVLGQADFVTGTATNTQSGMNQPRGLAYDSANQRLFVGQVAANRVTIYDVAAITNGEPAINVLGQATFTASAAATTQAGMNTPFEVTYDPNSDRIYVANFGAHRVTIYDVAGITNGEAAIDLLGQYDGTSYSNPVPLYTKAGANDTPNRLGFNQPQGLVIDRSNNRAFVADTTNNRVLVYNLDANGAFLDRIPDRVLGQVNFTANAAAITQIGLSGPSVMAYDPTKNLLYVLNVNRVSVFDVAGITNGEAAVNVLGQATFTANTAGNTQVGMNSPRGIALDVIGQRLFVSQNGNNRVTVYDVSTLINGEAATNVLGQFTFTATAASSTASGMNAPRGVAYDPNGDRLFVASSGNHRVTVFDVSSITNGEPATNIIGQPNFATTAAAITQAGLSTPTGIAYDEMNDRLFVANLTAHRITAYDTSSVLNGMNASHVFGQSDFTLGALSNSQQGINAATALAFDATAQRLYAGQLGNHRVSVFDTSIAGYTVTETGGSTNITENAATDTIEIVLTAPTLDSVTFDISSNDVAASTTPATVTFTSTTWDIPQSVTVFAPPDANLVNESATLTVSVNQGLSDNGFDLLANQDIAVTVTDDDVDTDGDTIIDDIDTDDDNDTILDSIEDAGPNSGDINNNALLDSLESTVASIPNAVNSGVIGLVLDGGCSEITSFTATTSGAYPTDSTYTYPLGFADFTANCSAPGESATATVIFVTNQAANSVSARKYNPNTLAHGPLNAVMSDVVIGATNAIQSTYVIQDGGAYDMDTLIDSAITDPIGLGVVIPIVTPVSSGGGGGSTIYGCKDKSALNYNPSATVQNHNSCQYAVAPLPVVPPPVITPIPTPESPVCKITKLPTKPIRLGATNDPEQVKLLEAYLNAELGLTLPIDGIYAKTDMDAVIAWQERYAPEILQPWGITKGTGFVSTFSLKKLASIQSSQCHPATTPAPKTCFVTTGNLVRGDKSSDILRLQKILAKQGYLKATPNGNFGPATYAAVIAFQAINTIEQTGTVGPLTKQAFKTLNLCN